mgnify:CR=1 FL=1
MIIKTAALISIPPGYKNPYNGARKRVGKTARDRANDNARRNAERKLRRAEWQKSASKTNPPPFPV